MSGERVKETSGWCLNSARWLVLVAWNLKTCPYTDKMRNGCHGCAYYQDKPETEYYRRRRGGDEMIIINPGGESDEKVS